jgi:hypothetical protein
MAHRQYRDEQDVMWQVWDIHPIEVARQLRAHADADHSPARMAVSGELVGGWLCFESAREKRRLWPIPAGWEELSDAELTALCASAVNAPERSPGRLPRQS